MKLRLWIRTAGENLLGIFMLAAAFLVMLAFNGSGVFQIWDVCLPIYLMISCCLLLFITSLSGYSTYMPMALACGSTRRDAQIGMQMAKLLPVLVCTAVVWLFCLVYGGEGCQTVLQVLPVMTFGAVIAGSIGSLGGCVSCRFGTVGAVVAIAVCAIFGGGIGALSMISLTGAESLVHLPGIFGKSVTGTIGGIALLLLAADAAMQRWTLRKYEVKL